MYLLTAVRNLRKRLGYTFINILGLTMGVASCLVIFLIVRYELNYDGFYKLSDRTYRVYLHGLDYNPAISPGVAAPFRNDFPEAEQVTQVLYRNDVVVHIGNDAYREAKYAFADEHLPQVFDFHWLAGDPRTALKEPGTVVLTESLAKKYFGNTDALGRTINLYGHDDYKVTGVIQDMPGNTHVQFEFVASLVSIAQQFKDAGFYSIWGGSSLYCVLPQGYPASRIERRMKAFITTHWGKDLANEASLGLQPIRDIRFDQRFLHTNTYTTTSRQTYWGLAGIALFIIVIACINFVNLATGLAATRAKEVGVRKVLGARRPQLVWQFLGETAVIVFFCVGLGLTVASLAIPTVDRWLDIRVHGNELFDPAVLGLLGVLLVVVILLAGVYPAFVQSAFLPALSLKGVSRLGGQGLNLRKGLVVVQFAICQLLIIGTLVVAQQMDFFENQDLGFNKESVVSFPLPNGSSRAVMEHLFASDPGISAYSFSSGAPADGGNWGPFHSAALGMPKDEPVETMPVDERYIRMFDLKMLAGDTIAPKAAGDSLPRLVVNETLLQKLHLTPATAIGKRISFYGYDNVPIVGVVQDFQSESKHFKRRPCALFYDSSAFYMACIRIYPQNVQHTLAAIGKAWAGINPRGLFEYEFLDDHIAKMYTQEQKVYTAFRLFSVIAILIGCLGLYGLVAFAAVQRTREVGIRKVLGASIADIVFLFAREFIVLIGVAFVVAMPIAWMIMHQWLESFAYRIGIGWGLFAVAILVSFAIAAFTISWESIKAAVVNPVRSLRSE
jgi:putative ABC transport system permease protein